MPSARLDAYDQGNGSVNLAWTAFAGITPASYNVYVNGVLNQNVAIKLATVTGLTFTTYNPSAISAATGNSLRPQNMPPVGQVIPSLTYIFRVAVVVGGVEVGLSGSATVTAAPTSIMLRTPMKRLWPFPNTGLD